MAEIDPQYESNIYGGGLLVIGSSPHLSNIIISNNVSSYVGGGMALYLSDLTLNHVSIIGNIADAGGAGLSPGKRLQDFYRLWWWDRFYTGVRRRGLRDTAGTSDRQQH